MMIKLSKEKVKILDRKLYKDEENNLLKKG
jgi:hypothetical protein